MSGLVIENIWDATKPLLIPPVFQNLDKKPKPAAESIILTWADVIVTTWKNGRTNLLHPCTPPPPTPHVATVLPTDWVVDDMVSYGIEIFNAGKHAEPDAPRPDIGPATVAGPKGNMARWMTLIFTTLVANLPLVVNTVAYDGCAPHEHTWAGTALLATTWADQIIQGVPTVFQPYAPTPVIEMMTRAFCLAVQTEIASNGTTTPASGPGHFHMLT